MITLFTIPKPFRDEHIILIQRNAIQSWLQLRPACQVILCGQEAGVAEVAREFSLLHLPDIACNEHHTPLLDDAFQKAQAVAEFSTLAFVNADIVLLPGFLQDIQQVPFKRYLMVGARWNLDVTAPLDFSRPAWQAVLLEAVRVRGRLQPPLGSDYFVFPKGALGDLPPFAVGRPGWDNWMIYHARSLGLPVIDATDEAKVIHQNHDYSHIAQRYNSTGYAGPEADRNLEIMGGNRTRFLLYDATHVFRGGRLRLALARPYLKRRFVTLAALHPRLRPLAELVKRLRRGTA